MQRRTFLEASIATAGLAFGAPVSAARERHPDRRASTERRTQDGSPSLDKFVDELPRPQVAEPTLRLDVDDGVSIYDISMSETTQQLHRDLPATTLWGYEGLYPGPTIEARQGERVVVRWANDLPDDHLFEVDGTIHGAIDNPEVRTVPHLHGGHVPAHSDGYPEAWFTPGFEETGPFYESERYVYPNDQPPTTLWYHDHAIGITRLNVYSGLAGFYLLRDGTGEDLDLPQDEYELPILLQDRTVAEDGSLVYPAEWEPEFFGDVAVVNGKIWPYAEVEPRKYGLRLLNGSNARFYNLGLFVDGENGGENDGGDENTAEDEGDPGPPMHQIGTDGGYLPEPVTFDPSGSSGESSRLLLAPAERADVIVDFSSYAGSSLVLRSNARTPFKGLDQESDEVPLRDLMQFRVADEASESDDSALPSRLVEVPRIPERAAQTVRGLDLNETQDEEIDRLELQLDGLDWDEPMSEVPRVGKTEIWQLINVTEDVHPIHLHLVQFQVLDRRPFDVNQYEETGELVYTGGPVEPAAQGWKDTVSAFPGEVTRFAVHFGEFEGLFSDRAGRYVWHCHILEHEDNEMMRPYAVIRRS